MARACACCARDGGESAIVCVRRSVRVRERLRRRHQTQTSAKKYQRTLTSRHPRLAAAAAAAAADSTSTSTGDRYDSRVRNDITTTPRTTGTPMLLINVQQRTTVRTASPAPPTNVTQSKRRVPPHREHVVTTILCVGSAPRPTGTRRARFVLLIVCFVCALHGGPPARSI
uniref:Uncharacterized protein n=1 Tax=Sipha flava TaxID=143950 RepID=A0A2S2R0V0_9HEMI